MTNTDSRHFVEPLHVRAIRAAVEGTAFPTLDDPEVRTRFLDTAQNLIGSRGACAIIAAFAHVVLEVPLDRITNPKDHRDMLEVEGIPLSIHEGVFYAQIVAYTEGWNAGDFEHADVSDLAALGRVLLNPASLIPCPPADSLVALERLMFGAS